MFKNSSSRLVFLLCQIFLHALALVVQSAFMLLLVGSCLNLSWTLFCSLIASLQVLEKHGLLEHFGTAEVLGMVFSAMSFKMEVIKDISNSRLMQASTA